MAVGLESFFSRASAGENFDIVTGGESTASYAVGIGISSLVKVKLRPTYKIDMSLLKSDNVVDAMHMMQDGEAQFAIVDSTASYFAKTGTGMFSGEAPDASARAIATLWREAQHIVIDRTFMQTSTVTDLGAMAGEPVSFGVPGSGAIEANEILLGQFGIDMEEGFDLADLNPLQSAQALSQGRISAMSTPARPPAAHIQNMLATSGDRYGLLGFDDEQVTSADGGLGLWTPYVIPASTYAGQEQDIQTVAKSSLLIVRDDVDDEAVYQMTKAIFEQLDFLRNSHESMKETSLEGALIGIPIALHPGALRYYQEVGLLGSGDDTEVVLAKGARLAETVASSPDGTVSGLTPGRIVPGNGTPEVEAPQENGTVGVTTIVPSTAPFADLSVDARTFVIHFGQDEEVVNGIGLQQLEQVRIYADSLTDAEISIDGHSSAAGSSAQNANLAEARTQSVIDVLKRTLKRDSHEFVVEPGDGAVPATSDSRPDLPSNRRIKITVSPLDAAGNAQRTAAPGDVQRTAVPGNVQRMLVVPGEDDEQPFWRKRASLQ